MTTINMELFEALKSAGAAEEKAYAAAANTEFQRIDDNIKGIHTAMSDIRGELKFHRWMLGAVVAVGLGVLWKMFELSSILAAIQAGIG